MEKLIGVADKQDVAVAGGAKEGVGELERKHRRLVDNHQVVILRQRPVLVALKAAVVGRITERAMDGHRVVASQVAHPSRCLSSWRAQQHALARIASDLDEHALGVRLPRARKPRQKHQSQRAHQLDDGPLLIRDIDRRPDRLCEQLDRLGEGTLREIGGEPPLHLP